MRQDIRSNLRWEKLSRSGTSTNVLSETERIRFWLPDIDRPEVTTRYVATLERSEIRNYVWSFTDGVSIPASFFNPRAAVKELSKHVVPEPSPHGEPKETVDDPGIRHATSVSRSVMGAFLAVAVLMDWLLSGGNLHGVYPSVLSAAIFACFGLCWISYERWRRIGRPHEEEPESLSPVWLWGYGERPPRLRAWYKAYNRNGRSATWASLRFSELAIDFAPAVPILTIYMLLLAGVISSNWYAVLFSVVPTLEVIVTPFVLYRMGISRWKDTNP